MTALLVLTTVCLSSCGGGSSSSGGGSHMTPPPPVNYTISGSVSGLSGTGLVLQNNGANDLSINANGSFSFGQAIAAGTGYKVTVLTQPSNPAQTCVVANSSGTAEANITNIQVTCTNTSTSYSVGGTVTGLLGSGLVLQNNGGDNLLVNANGSFTFPTMIANGSAYNVAVLTQPANPSQTCMVSNGSGTANADVNSIQVACTTATITYTIGGIVSGLTGTGLVLQDNGGDNLTVSADGSFTFPAVIGSGSTYNVTVLTQPTNPAQDCVVSFGSGTAIANVTNVAVNCGPITYTVGGTLSGLSGGTVVLQDNGASNLSLSANGAFTFATAITAGSSYDVTVKTQPKSQFCSVTNATGTANAKVSSVQVSCAATKGNTIQQSFFNGDFFLQNLVWPGTDGLGHTATMNGIRLWDNNVKWGQIETAANVYNWVSMDNWVSMAQSEGYDVLYTFGDTPEFAGTIPKPPTYCLTPTAYSCSAPKDLNTDGTGTDEYFSTFVTTLVTRYKGQIAYYDLWNEPDCSCFFAGTQAQMVRMNKDAAAIIRSIDPAAKILSPSGHVWTLNTWFDAYIAAGGAATFDIVNMHMRGNGTLNNQPENFLTTYANIEADLVTHKLNNLPLWDTEHGIKLVNNVTDPDELAGYAAREIALRAGIGIPRQYIYAWNDTAPVGLEGNSAGTAWDTMAGWLIGHSISPCVGNGTVYTCAVDNGQLVWDTAQSCKNGVCTTSNYTYPAGYAWQTDLNGTKTAITGKTVPIGYKPIFLTAQ